MVVWCLGDKHTTVARVLRQSREQAERVTHFWKWQKKDAGAD